MDTDQKLYELEQRVKKLEDIVLTHDEGPILTKSKKMSSKEFLMTKRLNFDIDKALALGYYLEYVEGVKSFNSSDLVSAFRSAKEPVPVNINDVVNKNIAKGFVMESDEKKDSKKAWCLTSTGEIYVKENLSN